jgi:hypothetical protein
VAIDYRRRKMQMVKIKDSIYKGKVLKGDYPFVSVTDGDVKCEREVYVRLVHNGKEINVHANRDDFQVINPPQPVAAPLSEEDQKLDALIKRRFEIMAQLTDMVIGGDVRSMIISGAAGIGKSYNLEKRLNAAIDNDEIGTFTILKGKISAIALFAQLFQHKEKGDILVLDDIDVIFQDETSLNLLKGALDTGDKRTLTWLTASDWLENEGVDQQFDFEGACIFITNLDFDRMMARGTSLQPHFEALISRSIYLDLAIHTNKEILTRIKQVVNHTTMLDVHGIDNTQKESMMDWLEGNYENLRELSLRTILKLAAFMKGDPKGWRDIAHATMVRNAGFTVA